MRKKIVVMFEYESTDAEQDQVILTHISRSLDDVWVPLEEELGIELIEVKSFVQEE